MSKFQVILVSIFIICIVGGVAAFATYKGRSNENKLPAITVWGTFPESTFTSYIRALNGINPEELRISYRYIAENSFDKTFIESLARGEGPDAILISQDLLHRHEDKLTLIPDTILTQRDFLNTFVPQAELYLHPSGILALPFVVDPLVMYWNRDVFTNAGIAVFPKYWDEFSAAGQKITQKDVNSNVRRSVLALGEFSNINHAREILSTLFLQAGNPITYRQDDMTLASSLGSGSFAGFSSSMPAVEFFTKFSNPRNPDYSWNRSLPVSKNFFLSGNLATYIGYASELYDIREKNPNLNFDVAPLPQARGGNTRTTYGKMYGFSIVRTTQDANATYAVLTKMLTADALQEMVTVSYLPPVRRDMIAAGSTDPYLTIFYDSALISRGWLDTNKTESTRIFRDIVESVTSGRKDLRSALEDGSNELYLSLQNI